MVVLDHVGAVDVAFAAVVVSAVEVVLKAGREVVETM